MFDLESPTLLDWYSYSVEWLVDFIIERRQVRKNLTQISISGGTDVNSATLELQVALTDLTLGRTTTEPLPIAVNAAIAIPVVDQTSQDKDHLLRTSTLFPKLVDSDTTHYASSVSSEPLALLAKLKACILNPFRRRTLANVFLFETILPTFSLTGLSQIRRSLALGGIPVLDLDGDAVTRDLAISEFNGRIAAKQTSASTASSLFKVHEPLTLGLPLKFEMPPSTDQVTSFRHTLAYSKQVSRVEKLITTFSKSEAPLVKDQISTIENTMLMPTAPFSSKSISDTLEGLGYSQVQLFRLASITRQSSRPREVLAILSKALLLSTDSERTVLDNFLATQLPTVAAISGPMNSMLPFLLFNLPKEVDFNYTNTLAAPAVVQAWVHSADTLSERCHGAILRLIMHYSADLAKRRNAGLPYDSTLVEFRKLGYVLQGYITKLSIAEAFELSTGSANSKMQELAKELLTTEIRMLNPMGANLEISKYTDQISRETCSYGFYAANLHGNGTHSVVVSETQRLLSQFVNNLQHYSIVHQAPQLANVRYYAAGHPLSQG